MKKSFFGICFFILLFADSLPVSAVNEKGTGFFDLSDTTEIQNQLRKGDHYLTINKDSSIRHYEMAYILAEKLFDQFSDSAEAQSELGIQMKYLFGKSLLKKGVAYKSAGDFSKAIKWMLESQQLLDDFRILESNPLTQMGLAELSNCYLNLALVFEILESYKVSEEKILLSLKYVKSVSDPNILTLSYLEIAGFYLNRTAIMTSLSQQDTLMAKADSMISLAEKVQYDSAHVLVQLRFLLIKAHRAMLNKNFKSSLQMFSKAEKLLSNQDENYWKALTYSMIAETYLAASFDDNKSKQKYLLLSISYAGKSLEHIQPIGAIMIEKKINGILRNSWAELGNMEKYRLYAEKYITNRDSIVSLLKAGTLSALEQEYLLANEEQRTAQLLLQKDLLRKKLNNERLFMAIMVLMFLFVIFALFLINNNRKKQRKLLLQISENEKHLKALVQSIPGTFYRCLTDVNFTMIYLGDEVLKLTGYSKEAFLSKEIAFNNLIHPDDRRMVAEKIQDAIRLKQPYVLEYRIIHKDIKIVHVFERGMAEFDNDGEPNMLDGTILDISDKIEAENELKYIYKLSDRALDLTKSGFWQIKLNDNQHYIASDRARGIFGFVESDVLPELKTIIQRIAALNPDSALFIVERLKKLFTGEEDHFETEHEYLHPQSGEALWIKSKAYVDKDENGNPVSLYGVSQDITITKRLQKDLETAREAAEAATKAKSDFLANMSHEIRTPMNAIIGMTHLVQKTKLDEKQLDYVSKISRSANALLGIINDILDFSKIEAGKLNIENIDFELQEVLDGVTDLVLQKARQKNLEFLIRIDPAVPSFLVGDPLRLGQVITNLCSNAVKFTEEGEIVVDVSVDNKTDKTINLKVEVKDSGIGLTIEQQQKLFQAFSQADTSTTRKYGGTGLGLTISQNLVKLMSGTIGVESEQGKGSNFYFRVTCGISIKENRNTFKAPLNVRGMKVMVCDDNETAREILAEALRIFTFEVTLTSSAREAITLLQQPSDKAFELLLLDYKMPEINGLEALSLISNDPLIAHKPKVIMVSAYGKEVLEGKNDYPLIEGFIDKPLNYSTLFNSIMNVFGQQSQRVSKLEESNDELIQKLKERSGNIILLVEDNEINQQVAKEIIEETGLIVEIAGNGEIAVEMVRQSGIPSKYKLVLMDLQMPVMDGITATQEIRKMHDYITLPILAMTADAMAGVKEKVLEAGMMDMLTKPIDPNVVYKKILKWMVRAGGIKLQNSVAMKQDVEQNDLVIPEIPGLETEVALQRLNGNKKLYLSILEKYYQNNLNFIQDISVLITASDSESLKRQFHTLKGLSGSVGATEIQQLAQELEQLVESAQLDKLQSLLPSLDEKMKVLFEEIHSKLIVRKQSINKVESAPLEPLINELEELIKKKSPQAKKLLPELEQAGLNNPAFQKLKRALATFNFKEAGIQLVEIKKNNIVP
ncbi:MAG: response regulator [Bacteroidales bacterium]|nr:response regulator [Bacteroidales bacterium]